jgi:hypothetical protein
MKHLLIFLLAVLSFSFVKAADPSLTLGQADGYLLYTGVAKDTCGTGDTVIYVTIAPNKLNKTFYSFKTALTKVSGTGVNRTILQARKHSTDTWTNIATVRTWGTATDTAFTQNQTSTLQTYREYRLQISKTSGTLKTKINYVESIFQY